jgi:transcriptional regulator with XRE-family HTH domain
MAFCDRLKNLRDEKGLSQVELAKILNISRQSVGNYENGLRFPNDEKLIIKIADYFNVSIDYLFGKTNIRNFNIIIKEDEETYCKKNSALENLFHELDKLSPETIKKITYTIKLFNKKNTD